MTNLVDRRRFFAEEIAAVVGFATPQLVDYAGGGSAVEWTKTVDGALALGFDTVVPGHGVVTTRQELQKFRTSTMTLRTRVHDMMAKKSLITRVWMASGKKVYYWITRDMLRFTDREGGGPRLVYDAPRLAARLKAHPQVGDAVIVAYPDRRAGTGKDRQCPNRWRRGVPGFVARSEQGGIATDRRLLARHRKIARRGAPPAEGGRR